MHSLKRCVCALASTLLLAGLSCGRRVPPTPNAACAAWVEIMYGASGHVDTVSAVARKGDRWRYEVARRSDGRVRVCLGDSAQVISDGDVLEKDAANRLRNAIATSLWEGIARTWPPTDKEVVRVSDKGGYEVFRTFTNEYVAFHKGTGRVAQYGGASRRESIVYVQLPESQFTSLTDSRAFRPLLLEAVAAYAESHPLKPGTVVDLPLADSMPAHSLSGVFGPSGEGGWEVMPDTLLKESSVVSMPGSSNGPGVNGPLP